MTMSIPPNALPMAFDLKRRIARHRDRFWCGRDLADIPAAPVYLFPDSARFDDDTVDALAQTILDGPPNLPHERVIFEVTMPSECPGSVIAYAMSATDHVEAFLFQYCRQENAWTDVICRASIQPDGFAETETHPLMQDYGECNRYSLVLTGMVWRSLGLLSVSTTMREQSVPVARRPKLSRAGVIGWTYRIVDIDLGGIRTSLPSQSGSHASPRWHIRRGYWRVLRDGRRVFVRECEVGDQARGGVVKDYRMDLRSAA